MTRSRAKNNTSKKRRNAVQLKFGTIVASIQTEKATYLLEQSKRGWSLLRSIDGVQIERFPLDYDKRHQRFFLTERDQRYVGIDGLIALEKLARATLDR